MWTTAVTILHILTCIFLVVVVLLQTGKGADAGAVFGGSSQTIFGSSGAGNFLTRLTSVTAAIFMATSLFLTYGAARQTKKSIFDEAPPAPAATTPAIPEQAPTTPSGTSGTTSDKPAEAPVASQTAPTSPAPAPSPAPSPSASPASPSTSSPTPSQGTATVTVIPTTPSSAEPAKTPSAPAPAGQTKPK